MGFKYSMLALGCLGVLGLLGYGFYGSPKAPKPPVLNTKSCNASLTLNQKPRTSYTYAVQWTSEGELVHPEGKPLLAIKVQASGLLSLANIQDQQSFARFVPKHWDASEGLDQEVFLKVWRQGALLDYDKKRNLIQVSPALPIAPDSHEELAFSYLSWLIKKTDWPNGNYAQNPAQSSQSPLRYRPLSCKDGILKVVKETPLPPIEASPSDQHHITLTADVKKNLLLGFEGDDWETQKGLMGQGRFHGSFGGKFQGTEPFSLESLPKGKDETHTLKKPSLQLSDLSFQGPRDRSKLLLHLMDELRSGRDLAELKFLLQELDEEDDRRFLIYDALMRCERSECHQLLHAEYQKAKTPEHREHLMTLLAFVRNPHSVDEEFFFHLLSQKPEEQEINTASILSHRLGNQGDRLRGELNQHIQSSWAKGDLTTRDQLISLMGNSGDARYFPLLKSLSQSDSPLAERAVLAMRFMRQKEIRHFLRTLSKGNSSLAASALKALEHGATTH